MISAIEVIGHKSMSKNKEMQVLCLRNRVLRT
jgi:hypothetical protein